MSPKTPSQFLEIRNERKQLIMEVALEIFAEQGFHQASMSQIAKRAKISKGLIYNYFESKDELMHEIVLSAHTYMLHHLSIDENNSQFNNLIELVEKVFDMIDENREFWKIYFLISMQEDVLPHVQQSIGDIMLPLTKELNKIFKIMQIPKPEVEAKFFDALLDGIILNYVLEPEDLNKEYVLTRIREIYAIRQK